MLDERKKKVLQAIVEEYINTAEPVSSNSITNNHGLNCSSATIRNEMSELEKNGFLDKTHTSSGRIPSEKGYRYYVDELINDNDISVEEIKYISSKLETKVNEIEDLTKLTATTISNGVLKSRLHPASGYVSFNISTIFIASDFFNLFLLVKYKILIIIS